MLKYAFAPLPCAAIRKKRWHCLTCWITAKNNERRLSATDSRTLFSVKTGAKSQGKLKLGELPRKSRFREHAGVFPELPKIRVAAALEILATNNQAPIVIRLVNKFREEIFPMICQPEVCAYLELQCIVQPVMGETQGNSLLEGTQLVAEQGSRFGNRIRKHIGRIMAYRHPVILNTQIGIPEWAAIHAKHKIQMVIAPVEVLSRRIRCPEISRFSAIGQSSRSSRKIQPNTRNIV